MDNNWISVKDRLPKSGTMCLTCSPKGKMRVAEAFLPSTIPNSSYDPMECWWQMPGGKFIRVTHWMPLPDLPNEEQCSCFHIEYGQPVCWGTKEKDACSCGGYKSKCNIVR